MPDFGRWTSNGGDPSLNEINRTDRFLDALAFEQPVYATDAGEAELVNLLSGWRDDIRDAPLTVPVTPRDAVIALDSAQRTHKRSRRTLALVGSTAAAVLCLGGFASVVAGAGPGDSLYGLRTMIFGEQPATRDDAVMLASQQLAEVQQLVDEGQWDAAQQKLQTLTTTVATVNDDVRKQELVTEWQELTVKVDAQDAAAVLPPDVPPPVFPDVVVLQTPTSSDTSAPETTPPSDTSTSPATTSPSDTTSPSSPTTPSSSPTSQPTSAPSSSQPPPTSPPVQAPPPTSVPATVEPTSGPSTPPASPTSEEVPPPTSSVATPPPTTTTTVAMTTKSQPAQSSTVTEAAEEAPPSTVEAPPATVEAPPATVQAPPTTVVAPPPQRQPPPVQRQAPVTTTFVMPKPETGSSGDGS
ncbi:anti-sigma-D factor RsdA [Mycolicibacterium tusciae]|uniref:anti-sigma-D factor RsdA n=1 Tax=Mycolicibacterium tusciae TaxID=75922 RepID=UPI00024A127D|nr:anti-sigma-D factor RsdA [Mycolicibacterium tusciae]